MIKAMLLHLGTNMWAKKGAKAGEDRKFFARTSYSESLVTEKEEWIKITNSLAEFGFNTLLIDMGEGVQLGSHPELAIEGSWTQEEFKEELARLRSIGLTPIPKFNFSCGHSAWLKDYAYMVGTETYNKVCRDVVEETIELFDTPEFFHLGLEEEEYGSQKRQPVAITRAPYKKREDALFLFDVCMKKGVRPWIWIDLNTLEAFGGEEVFRKTMPRELVVSNWYYGFESPNKIANGEESPRFKLYERINSWGFDQIPTSSTWSSNLNTKATMQYCKERASDSVIGYMTAPWFFTTERQHYALMNDMACFSYAWDDVYGGEEK